MKAIGKIILPGMQAEAALVFDQLRRSRRVGDARYERSGGAGQRPDAVVHRLEAAAATRGVVVEALLIELLDGLVNDE